MMKVLFAVCLLGLSLAYAKPLDLDLIEKLLELNEELETRGENKWGGRNGIARLTDYAETMVEQWKNLVHQQDVEGIVSRFANSGVYIRLSCQGNAINEVKRAGKRGARQMYEAWFQSGVARLEVDVLDVDLTDNGNRMILLERVKAFNNGDNLIETNTISLIFRKVEDGFETLRKTEVVDNLNGC